LTDLVNTITEAAAMSGMEIVAVAFAIAYLLLAIRQNILCWIAAIASSGIYVALMYAAGLYMESVLQFFYIGMALYGWFSWQHGEGVRQELPVTSWPLAFHVLPLSLIAVLTVLSGSLLESYSDAVFPYLDSFTTWSAVITTWMVARKVLQNWHYWFVIDSLSVYLYISRGLLLTALLFSCYLVLIIFGYRAWHQSMGRLQSRVS
jgi:nicotinamide mononucleotide transporter